MSLEGSAATAPPVGPVAIEFHLTAADQGAMAVHYLARTPDGRSATTKSTLRVTFMLVLLGLVAMAFTGKWQAAAYFFAGAAIAFFLFPFYVRSSVRRTVERRPVSGLCPCRGGRHHMDATEQGLRVVCDAADTLRPWHAIAAVDETPEHLFLMLHGGIGYVVPRETMLGGDLAAFTAAAHALRARAHQVDA